MLFRIGRSRDDGLWLVFAGESREELVRIVREFQIDTDTIREPSPEEKALITSSSFFTRMLEGREKHEVRAFDEFCDPTMRRIRLWVDMLDVMLDPEIWGVMDTLSISVRDVSADPAKTCLMADWSINGPKYRASFSAPKRLKPEKRKPIFRRSIGCLVDPVSGVREFVLLARDEVRKLGVEHVHFLDD